MNNKRLAGSKLVLEPIGDISENIRSALARLKETQPAPDASGAAAARADEYPRIDETFEVDGHRINLNANPSQIQWDPEATIDGKVLGNQQEMRELMNKPPEVEYGMTWSVDGQYGDYGEDIPKGSRLKIAREAQRRWGQAFKQLPDNAIVSNSPVGASQGQYGRADLYMASGFGPVQHNGSQFGIVRGGEIQPLSPFVADPRHVSHLARRARMAGDVDLEQAMLVASRSNPDINTYGSDLYSAKSINYDDDYYSDDDSYPPLTRREAEEIVRREKVSDQGVPEISMRQMVDDQRMDQGFDFEVTADDLYAMREAQLEALQADAPFRGVTDALQEVRPRPLPQRITEQDLVSGRRGSRRYDYSDGVYSLQHLGQAAPGERRAAIDRLIRREVDGRVQGRIAPENRLLPARNDIKGTMVEPVGSGSDYIQQALYSTQDVADLRRMQEALAIAGEMSGPETRRRGRYARDPIVDGQGKAGQDYRQVANSLTNQPLAQLEDPRLRRPTIPAREMVLRGENQRRERNIQQANATNPSMYDEAPADMSFDEFRAWEQTRQVQPSEQRVLVADEAIADAVGEGLFSRALSEPANYALATERGQRQARSRRRRRRPQTTFGDSSTRASWNANEVFAESSDIDGLINSGQLQVSPLDSLLNNFEEARNAPPLF